MGIDELFYGGFMWLGRYSGIKKLMLSFFFVIASNFAIAEHPFTTDNKAKIIARDLLEQAYNRTHNLPTVVSDSTSMKNIHRANTLRSIAKKLTRASGVLYSKHPVTGLAISLGFGYLLDETIDGVFEKFTSASKDESGNFYVMIKDPKTGKLTKMYLDEEPSIYNPVYINVSGSVNKTEYSSYDGKSCKSTNLTTTLRCIAEDEIKERVDYQNKLLGQTASKGKFLSFEEHPLYKNGYFVNYSYERCFTSNNECRTETDVFSVNALVNENKTKVKPYAIKSKELSEKLHDFRIQDDKSLINFYKTGLSLNSQEFTDEERKIISNISSRDLRRTYSEPSLSANELHSFTYSDDMFDNLPRKETETSGKVSTETSIKTVNYANVDFSSPDVDMPDVDIPTAKSILEPFNKFFPNLQNLKINVKQAQCPVWSFELYDRVFKMDKHCPLLEEQRALISLIFSIVWGFISLRNLLSA